MPSGLIDEEDGVGSWCDRLGDFREVQVHRFGIAGGQDQSRALAQFRADGAEDIGRCGSLIPRGTRRRHPFGDGIPAGPNRTFFVRGPAQPRLYLVLYRTTTLSIMKSSMSPPLPPDEV